MELYAESTGFHVKYSSPWNYHAMWAKAHENSTETPWDPMANT